MEAGPTSRGPDGWWEGIVVSIDADNLTLRSSIQLPENMAGKTAVSSDGSVIYAASDSGVMVLPVGLMGRG